jgi:hypothetical protein
MDEHENNPRQSSAAIQNKLERGIQNASLMEKKRNG